MGAYTDYMDDYGFGAMMEVFNDPAFLAVLDVVLMVLAGVLAGIMLFGLIMYILESRGMQKLAKDRQIRHGWLAWIPVARMWVLGSIADQYQYVAKGRVRSRRKTLLWLTLSNVILALVQIVGVACYLGYLLEWFAIDYFVALQMYSIADILNLAVAIIGLIAQIHAYIALHDLYASCEPDSASAYLVISILIPITQPFFVFSCRNKEYGMPPRKPAMSVPTTWQPPEIPNLDEE